MKKIFFSGNILVASRKLAKGSFNWLATYSNQSNQVHIVAFDCEKKWQLAAKIKDLISSAADEQTLATLRAYDEQLAQPAYHKEIPDDLLRSVRRNFPLVTRENSIYLSGVNF